MRDDVEGAGPVRPVPSRDVVVRALALVDGGPTTVGPLGFRVCEVMGVDTAGCSGSYDLRQRISWPSYLSHLRRMTQAGELVVKTRQQWHDLTGGALFPEVRHGGTQAYATAAAYDELMAAVGAVRWSPADAVWALALHRARQRVLREYDDLVQRYAAEAMEADHGKP